MDYFTMVQIVIQITTASRYGSFEFEYQDTGYLFTFIDTSVRDRVALASNSVPWLLSSDCSRVSINWQPSRRSG